MLYNISFGHGQLTLMCVGINWSFQTNEPKHNNNTQKHQNVFNCNDAENIAIPNQLYNLISLMDKLEWWRVSDFRRSIASISVLWSLNIWPNQIWILNEFASQFEFSDDFRCFCCCWGEASAFGQNACASLDHEVISIWLAHHGFMTPYASCCCCCFAATATKKIVIKRKMKFNYSNEYIRARSECEQHSIHMTFIWTNTNVEMQSPSVHLHWKFLILQLKQKIELFVFLEMEWCSQNR